MGMTGVSKSQVSRLCEEIDERVHAFLDRPLEGEWPCMWLDATYVEVREAGRIVSVAAIIAVGVNSDGRREILGLAVGPSEAETFWTGFLRELTRRGHARTPERRGQTPLGRHRHLPQRGGHHPPRRTPAARAERRVGDSAALHVAGNARYRWREWRGQATGNRQLTRRIPTVSVPRTAAVSTPRLGTRPAGTVRRVFTKGQQQRTVGSLLG